MVRSHKRLLALLGMLLVLVLLTTVLYMAGMSYLEGKPRGFWDALEWAGESLSTTGYGRDSNWSHPLMVSYVVLVQFVGVFLVFLVFPIYLIPFFEERFETRLPKEIPGLKNHVVIFDYGPPVATLLNELEQASIATVVVEEDEADARRLHEQGHRVIHGNLDEGVLQKTHLDQARALIVNSTDDRNAATILTARQLGFKGEILALVEDPYHREPIILAGASGAYTPRHVLGADDFLGLDAHVVEVDTARGQRVRAQRPTPPGKPQAVTERDNRGGVRMSIDCRNKQSLTRSSRS